MTVLLIIASVLVFVGRPLGWVSWANRTKPGATNMVLIRAAAGEAEAQSWVAALRGAGISARLQNIGSSTWYPTGPYAIEVWVRAKDERRARQVLGF
jgi:hypothetical protein